MASYSNTNDGTKAGVGSGSVEPSFLQAYNHDTAVRYVQLFNALAADVTVGTTTPVAKMILPASGGNTWCKKDFEDLNFSIGLTVAVTTTPTGSTGPTTAADVEVRFQ